MKKLPSHGTSQRYDLEKRAGRRPTPEDYAANARRVRDAYHADPRARELSAERVRRYRERQTTKAHRDVLARWVVAVMHAEGTIP